MMISRQSAVSCAALAALVLVVAGCKRDSVQTYQAPKDAQPAAVDVTASAPGTPTSPPGSSVDHAAGTPWKVPAGWETKTASDMRIASYGVTTPDGRAVDISVVALGGTAGSELDNINRWRKEVALDPITDAEIPGSRSTAVIGNRTATLYEFRGNKPTIDGKYTPAMLVGVLPAGELTVFFKMKGESELVTREKPQFLEWLKSVQTETNPDSSTAQSGTSSAPTPASTAPNDMRGQVAPPPQVDLPTWEPPAHWKASGPRPMRLASFEVPNTSGGTPGDLSISSLSGAAGGLAANVNRWRNQAGLPPLDDSALAKESEKIELSGGGSATLVDVRGASKRILGVIAPRGENTWFYKLTGDDALVTKERDAFIKFVKSVKY